VTRADFESPSLVAAGGGTGPAAYELKFLLDDCRAGEVEAWARRRLLPDPHGDPALGGAYRTTSLYSDTAELDVYRRTADYRRDKFRVRRYGAAPWAFLERKSKEDFRVAKRRTPVPEDDLPLLDRPRSSPSWPGRWFHRRLRAHRLSPVCRVVYQRTAYGGSCADGPLRLTLDRHLRGTLTGEWCVDPVDGGVPLLSGKVILELKFRGVLPAPFDELRLDLGLSPSDVSKYRLCREACAPAGRFTKRQADDRSLPPVRG
jgi:hypothetical protein